MDGYAVRAADVKNATEKHPAVLSVVETIAAGYAPTKQVAAGQASRIMTGRDDASRCRCRHYARGDPARGR